MGTIPERMPECEAGVAGLMPQPQRIAFEAVFSISGNAGFPTGVMPT